MFRKCKWSVFFGLVLLYWSSYALIASESEDLHRFFTDTVHDELESGVPAEVYGEQLGLDRLAESVEGISSEIIVAVLDTGIDTSNETLKDRLVKGYDAVDEDDSYGDKDGHGTHVAGIIALNTPLNVKIMPIKVFDDENNSVDSNIVTGIYYAVNNGAKVINMSLGGEGKSSYLEKAVRYAISKGVILVVSSGNNAHDMNYYYPASFEEVITVGATGQNGDLLYYSNTGEDLDLCAPGEKIISTYLNDEMKAMSGTSMASPFVSATVAMLWLQDMESDALEIREQLVTHTKDLGSVGWDELFGHGEIDYDNYRSNSDFFMIDFPDEGTVKEYKYDLNFSYFLADADRKIKVWIDGIEYKMTDSGEDSYYKCYLDIRNLGVGYHQLKVEISGTESLKAEVFERSFRIPEYNVRITCYNESDTISLGGKYKLLRYTNADFYIEDVEFQNFTNGEIGLNIDFSAMDTKDVYRVYVQLENQDHLYYLRVIGTGGEKIFDTTESSFYYFYQDSDYSRYVSYKLELMTHMDEFMEPNRYRYPAYPFLLDQVEFFYLDYYFSSDEDAHFAYLIVDQSDITLEIYEDDDSEIQNEDTYYLYYYGLLNRITDDMNLNSKDLMEVKIETEPMPERDVSKSDTIMIYDMFQNISVFMTMKKDKARIYLPFDEYEINFWRDTKEEYDLILKNRISYGSSVELHFGSTLLINPSYYELYGDFSYYLTDEFSNYADIGPVTGSQRQKEPILILEDVNDPSNINRIHFYSAFYPEEARYNLYKMDLVPDGIYTYSFERLNENIINHEEIQNNLLIVQDGKIVNNTGAELISELNYPRQLREFNETVLPGGYNIVDLNEYFFDPKDYSLDYLANEGYIIDNLWYYEDLNHSNYSAGIVAINDSGRYSYFPIRVVVNDEYDLDESVSMIPDIATIGASDWALSGIAEAINEEVVENEILDDYQNNLTRVEMCRQIIKALETKVGPVEEIFSVVFYDTWDQAVQKSADLGIVNGIGNGQFAPYKSITRQEFCVILYNLAKYLNPAISNQSQWNKKFTDESFVAEWAKDAVRYCVNQGIMNGISGKIEPKGYITREQAILMLARFF